MGNTQIINGRRIASVTAVGCCIADYTPDEAAPLFREATALANEYLPQVFWEVL